MNHSKCSRTARERIPSEIRRQIGKSSHFACCICGSIPIVLHHIEEWSKYKSNDEQYLIAICDKCHRGVHGKGGNLFSKDDLYSFKNNPTRKSLLQDKLPLEKKRSYSFFIGNNFIADGEKAGLIKFSGGHKLTTIDTSNGILKLSILSGVDQGEPKYLIKENEILIETRDIWDMHYSRNSLKIWRIVQGKKNIFIDISLYPDVIIIKEMHTIFNGIPFHIHKLRSPHKSQIDKMVKEVRKFEELYNEASQQIDQIPEKYGVRDGINYDDEIKNAQKMILKLKITQWLSHEFYKNFTLDWGLYQTILKEILEKSTIFRSNSSMEINFPEDIQRSIQISNERVIKIRERHKREFYSLKNTVVEYGGLIFNGNMMV